jgi:hypothetical protein
MESEQSKRLITIGSFGALLLADYLEPNDRHGLGGLLFFSGAALLVIGFLAYVRRDRSPPS